MSHHCIEEKNHHRILLLNATLIEIGANVSLWKGTKGTEGTEGNTNFQQWMFQ